MQRPRTELAIDIMHRHHAKRVFLVKRTKLQGPQVDCQELQKPPREPQGVPEISHLRAGNHSESSKKGKNNVDQQACR